MQGKRLFHSIVIDRLLSYGREGELIPLEPLNVLIGPNGSGKSNLIEAISLLAATPGDLARRIADGGGFAEWQWRGEGRTAVSRVGATLAYPGREAPIAYELRLKAKEPGFEIVREAIGRQPGAGDRDPRTIFDRTVAGAHVRIPPTSARESLPGTAIVRESRDIPLTDLMPSQSVLSQLRGKEFYPEITLFAEQFSAIRFYRKWSLGPDFLPRHPQRTNLPPGRRQQPRRGAPGAQGESGRLGVHHREAADALRAGGGR